MSIPAHPLRRKGGSSSRRSTRNWDGGRVWTGLGVAVAALSMIPIIIELATPATRVGLFVLHLVVAATLLPLARRDR